MNSEKTILDLRIMIICNDGRNDAWIQRLQARVSNLYMLKAGHCLQFTPEDPDGLSIPHSQLPNDVNALLFHSSDKKLWDHIAVQAEYTFEFNTPGTPQPKNNVIPIHRPTFPYFAIEPNDIDELLAFIAGQQSVRPSMCYPALTLDLLPALAILCQQYLAKTSEAALDIVSQPKWWLDSLGLTQQSELNEFCQHTLKRLEIEWKATKNPDTPHDKLDQLFAGLFTRQSDSYQIIPNPLSADIIVDAYSSLEEVLSIQTNALGAANSEGYVPEEIPPAILAVQGSVLAIATATILGMALDVKRYLLNLDPVDVLPDNFYTSTLVIAESQITCLPAMRLKGFAGAVLVLSTHSFSILKQKHRALRFGQGSHDALTIPFTLIDLYTTAKDLVPMGQANLKFLQNELRAVQQIYVKEILPCLHQLEQSDGTLSLEKIAILEKVIEKVRTETPVACHTVVTIGDKKLQIQEHLRQALKALKEQKEFNGTLSYLKAAFEHWYKLVQSAAGESLKVAS